MSSRQVDGVKATRTSTGSVRAMCPSGVIRSWYQVRRPSMLEGKTFFGATGIPILKIARVRTRLAVWLPDPLTVAAWMVRSLIICSVTSFLVVRIKNVTRLLDSARPDPDRAEARRVRDLRYIPQAVKVAIPKETAQDERRVALVPDTATKLIAAGLEVSVEEGAGAAAFVADEAFEKAGVKVVKGAATLLEDADVVLKVQ